MQSLYIKGGRPLQGEVTVGGAKNAVLPILAASLLTEETCRITRVPNLSDVRFMAQILESLGASVSVDKGVVEVTAKNITPFGDYELIRKMRGSICILGPLLSRLREARVSLPGGCIIGARPIDLHLKGLRALGCDIRLEGGYVIAKAPELRGTDIFLGGRAGPSVLGTANVMMAAVLAEGKTIITSAACEPEVTDLAEFLQKMGAKISGAGSPTLCIEGVEKLHGCDHEVIPDRIEAATFAIAAAATHGDVTVKDCQPGHMQAVIDKLRECGVKLLTDGTSMRAFRDGPLQRIDITTLPYAGFPTDVQAQMMALLVATPGVSIITERIFESRFMHVSELSRMGADITIEGPSAIVMGGNSLSGAPVMASDLRASAALIIAGLMAVGETEVKRIYHLDRGYEQMDVKLRNLGAEIERREASS